MTGAMVLGMVVLGMAFRQLRGGGHGS
jgi:hypothetical protein